MKQVRTRRVLAEMAGNADQVPTEQVRLPGRGGQGRVAARAGRPPHDGARQRRPGTPARPCGRGRRRVRIKGAGNRQPGRAERAAKDRTPGKSHG
nr:hypothetical protein GCM10020092_060000 [Actinoplanes digitatis]